MTQLLLLHGALGSKAQFDTIQPVLQQHGFSTDAINFAGHGGFAIPLQGYNFNVFANDILQYADVNKIEKLNLFGYSMGGYAALYFAKLHPGRVNRIATLNVKFNWDPLSTQKEIGLLNAEKMIEKVPSYAEKLMYQHGLNIWKQVLQSTADMMEKLSKDFVLTQEDFKQIKMPVLLGVGDKDTTTSISETFDVYKTLPDARLWVLPDTLHPFDRIHPAVLALELERFFTPQT